jgi:hypothetical protein
MADASNARMKPTGRVRVKLFQRSKHSVVVRGVIAYLPEDLRNDVKIKFIKGEDLFRNLFVDPKIPKALIQLFGQILA